jgi:hypothetical protein
LFELRQNPIDAGFVFERMLRRREGPKLIDVGARRKGLVAGALEHQHLDRTVAIGLVAECGEPLIHREGEGIARLRAIEGDPPDAVAQLVENVLRGVLGRLRLLVHFNSSSTVPHSSYAGSTRVSMLRCRMDCRIKSGNDAWIASLCSQ